MCCFLQRVPHSKEKIILIAPPPMKWGAWVTEERLLTESTKLGPEYAELENRLGVRFLDTGDWGITLAFDGVHFDEAGHQRFAKSLKQALREDTHTFEPI
jgi:lysophospholipase L1-like esterase